jgi:hypothetical protein
MFRLLITNVAALLVFAFSDASLYAQTKPIAPERIDRVCASFVGTLVQYQDSKFRDANGKPLVLPFPGEEQSFTKMDWDYIGSYVDSAQKTKLRQIEATMHQRIDANEFKRGNTLKYLEDTRSDVRGASIGACNKALGKVDLDTGTSRMFQQLHEKYHGKNAVKDSWRD